MKSELKFYQIDENLPQNTLFQWRRPAEHLTALYFQIFLQYVKL